MIIVLPHLIATPKQEKLQTRSREEPFEEFWQLQLGMDDWVAYTTKKFSLGSLQGKNRCFEKRTWYMLLSMERWRRSEYPAVGRGIELVDFRAKPRCMEFFIKENVVRTPAIVPLITMASQMVDSLKLWCIHYFAVYRFYVSLFTLIIGNSLWQAVHGIGRLVSETDSLILNDSDPCWTRSSLLLRVDVVTISIQ